MPLLKRESHPSSWEGEVNPNEVRIFVEKVPTHRRPASGVSFVIGKDHVRNDSIEVRVLRTCAEFALVEPIPDYVPLGWGLFGTPPRHFWVRKETLA